MGADAPNYGGADRAVAFSYDLAGNLASTSDTRATAIFGSRLPSTADGLYLANRLYEYTYDGLDRVATSMAHYVTPIAGNEVVATSTY